ncbi:HD domain-containing protein [Treponema zuelzerae]|uniref:HD domain-containing protein n=1 Tax=Teretinema zuelzerae TaxID=156 RepID=A0AAE3EFD3_9SPIR|nr:HD domain-containing protein [Teretinema zuelzerae]MCD1653287.1 HD domain-containing protein [Teretinema zuelzerae]
MLDRKFVLKIFEAFSIERWNDLVRPFEIIEMDKTAEKTVLAYMIGKFEEERGVKVDWRRIIYGSFFDLLRKIALCDIKAPVQRMIREEYPEEFERLNHWVLDQYRDVIVDCALFSEFENHLFLPIDASDSTSRILKAAHKYSTLREVEMLRLVNEPFRLIEIEKGLNRDLEAFLDLRCMQLLVTKQQPYDFLMQIERLRFQTRWNQTPRVPRTSVLGHSYFVAVMTLLLGRNSPLCDKRFYNNFFSALFHDLPEAVTRDIISPVKQATHHLPQIVKEIEDRIVERELLPLMDKSYRDELLYFTANEFENRIRDTEGKVVEVTYEELNESYNDEKFHPIDGKLVRFADHIAAFIEADSSIQYGITSTHLREGRRNILSLYPEGKVVNGIHAHAFFAEFPAAITQVL